MIEINDSLLISVEATDHPITAQVHIEGGDPIRLPFHENGSFCTSRGLAPSSPCTEECTHLITDLDLMEVH